MKVVFLLVLFVIVVGVALVAAGRGGSLPDVEPDSPPVGLPDDALEEGDLEAVRFPSALRGYRMRDVDEVLDRVASELAARDARIAELEGRAPVPPESFEPPPAHLPDGELSAVSLDSQPAVDLEKD